MNSKLITLSLLLSVTAGASVVSLPLGGKVTMNAKEWSIQETKALTGVNSYLISHRFEKDLQGVLLDGTVKNKGECEAGKTTICERVVPMGENVSYQIVGQRYHGSDTYQNYVFAFTFPKSQEKQYLPLLKKFRLQMELVK